jgi:hypothetical protein
MWRGAAWRGDTSGANWYNKGSIVERERESERVRERK